ncbi:hypothetical protein N7478_012984 [Penicillium angulare]|uniref:uncharacterized protein n=1 Tax=Penicillium angulare TaxID=116970 RepID=UPI002540F20C|nr:uncharacterized protein N7478_012984 [Penicillium angulare]KAJ5256880.1 hypothetical protein N7478_012984 [Penicillium angulare]
MPIGISHAEICAKFDRLISKGIIAYQPSESVLVTDKGMTFCFHIAQALENKPQAEDTIQAKPQTPPAGFIPGTFGPGSDIARDHPDVCLAIINKTHYLVVNKFPVFRPMLLLLTVDSYRRQSEPLALDDIDAGWQVMWELEGENYVFFNCTPTSGSSRAHKHVQVVPAPGTGEAYPEEFKLFPDYVPEPEKGSFPLRHFIQRFNLLPDGCVRDSEHLLEIYLGLLQKARDALRLANDVPCPHNFLMTKTWMVVIPRRARDCAGITANSPGMVGSIYVSNQELLDAWKDFGPMNVLTSLGLPQDEI